MEKGTDMDTVTAAETKLRRVTAPFSDWLVTPMGNYFESGIKSLKNDNAVILTLAVCLLVISPLVWYFSQIMFYRKRRNEFAVLHALGAPDSAFGKMHRLAGGVLSGAAFLVTILVSLLCNYLVYFTVNTLLPWLHLTESIRYEFTLSLPALIACVLVSVLCGYLSCELPYHLYTKPDIGVRRVD
jgi:ABC-type antimicrobial peptide transport system permease subunit